MRSAAHDFLRGLPIRVLLFVTSALFAAAVSRASDYPPFKLGLATQVVATGFELSPLSDEGKKLSFRPAESNYAGLTLGYRWLSGTIWFSVPAAKEVRAREGTSQYRDYRLSLYYKKMGVELAYNRYLAYLIENSSSLSSATLAGQTYYKLPELETVGYGATFYYVPNPGAYSLPAAMEQSEIQSKSGGAWVLLATFRQQHITNNSAIIPAEKQPDFTPEESISDITAAGAGVGGGYGFNWVPGVFFVAPMLAATTGYQRVTYELSSGKGSHGSIGFNLHVRLGFGINSRHFFLTAVAYADIYGRQTDHLRLSNNVQGATFSIGARF